MFSRPPGCQRDEHASAVLERTCNTCAGLAQGGWSLDQLGFIIQGQGDLAAARALHEEVSESPRRVGMIAAEDLLADRQSTYGLVLSWSNVLWAKRA
jgi:hypothetical protein